MQSGGSAVIFLALAAALDKARVKDKTQKLHASVLIAITVIRFENI